MNKCSAYVRKIRSPELILRLMRKDRAHKGKTRTLKEKTELGGKIRTKEETGRAWTQE
jgi:hypothetical protein